MNFDNAYHQTIKEIPIPDGLQEKITLSNRGQKRKPVKPLLIVAAIMVLSVTTAFAASPWLFEIGKTIWKNGTATSEADAYPISPALREYISTQEWPMLPDGSNVSIEELHDNYPHFSSVDEVNNFFGIALTKNEMLVDLQATFDESSPCILSIIDYEPQSDDAIVTLLADAKLSNRDEVFGKYTFFCYGTDKDDVDRWVNNKYKIDENSGNVQNYTSPVNGVEAILSRSGSSGVGYADFAINNISYHLTVQSTIDPYETLKAVIDAYR